MTSGSKELGVVVALSGGVDSTVVALKLLDDGRRPTAVHLKLWSPWGDEGAPEDSGEARARWVADKLGIPLEIVDVREAFQERVLRRCWDDYRRGKTPNPCVLCNQHIKFGLLTEKTRELGADELATGHHARLTKEGDIGKRHGAPRLFRGRDRQKDQSYFLAMVDDLALNRARFPLGEMTKDEVRRVAAARGLGKVVAAESQDVCVQAAGLAFPEILRRLFGEPTRSGVVRDSSGKVLGRHKGVYRYTIGQRKGLGVAARQRLYVVGLNPDHDEVVLGTAADLNSQRLRAIEVSWRRAAWDSIPPKPFDCRAQIRSRHKPTKATVRPGPEREAEVTFDSPQRAITAGQAVVFYRGDEVVGAGWIHAGLDRG